MQCAQARLIGIDVIQRPDEQVVQVRIRVLTFD